MKRLWMGIPALLILCSGAVIFGFAVIPESLTLTGKLEYQSVICIPAPFSGEIRRALVRPGVRVEEGEQLFQLTSADLETELWVLERQRDLQRGRESAAQRELQLADQAWESESALLRNALLNYQSSPESLPAREGLRRGAEIDLGAARHRANRLKIESQLQESRLLTESLERRIALLEEKIRGGMVRSPLKGLFLQSSGPGESPGIREVKEGQRCAEGMILGYVADPGKLDLKTEISPPFRDRILLMDSVSVRMPAHLNGGTDRYRRERILEFLSSDRGGSIPLRISWREGEDRIPAGTLLELKIPLRPLGDHP